MEYQIMPDIREKEKIVGGKLTLSQTIFVAVGVVIGGGVAMLLISNGVNIVFSILLGVILAIPPIFCGIKKFYEYGNIEYWRYILMILKYKSSTKKYVNVNENYKKYLRVKGGLK